MTGGLKLLPSPPPVRRSLSVVSNASKKDDPEKEPSAAGKAMSKPAGPVVVRNLVSEEAMQQVPQIAPGWDKHALRSQYEAWVVQKGEMPRNPDAAFLGWVRKFTKGKRPA